MNIHNHSLIFAHRRFKLKRGMINAKTMFQFLF